MRLHLTHCSPAFRGTTQSATGQWCGGLVKSLGWEAGGLGLNRAPPTGWVNALERSVSLLWVSVRRGHGLARRGPCQLEQPRAPASPCMLVSWAFVANSLRSPGSRKQEAGSTALGVSELPTAGLDESRGPALTVCKDRAWLCV